ncbi:MAG: endonuclease/exonuclease/phosphatase family protein [Saprospiraceae bacterium]|nr:endonuclease/exonuclease/phosphatase family protein [Pyrinomonadaceae bacterium]
MEIALIIIGSLTIAATAIPIVRGEAWWIRVLDFPRLQVTFVAALTLAAYIFFVRDLSVKEIGFLFLLAACLLYQGYMMFPYTPFARKQVQQSTNSKAESSFSLLFANVLESNRDSERLKQIIRQADPDILLTVETNRWWQGQLSEYEAAYPYTVLQAQENTYGMLFYSKLELIDPQVKFLLDDEIPSIHTRVRLRSGKEIELRCLHPKPPFPTEDTSSTNRDAEILIVGKENKENPSPFVVMGDLNDVAWSHTNYLFQDISGLLDPRVGRGFYNTFHAKFPFLRLPLDHFFHSKHFRLVDFRRLAYFGSDHFPVYIKLSYEAEAATEQEELHADSAQKEEAGNKIDKAG